MIELKKVLESKVKIRFQDCDPFNHLNNSRYIDYIVTERGEQLLDNYNLDIYQLAKEKGIGWVTAQTQISYLVPAFPQEVVVIETRLLAFSEKSLLLEAFMWNMDKTVLKAVLWIKLVHFHLLKQMSHSHPAELMDLFGRVVNPLSIETDFETRIKNLKQKSEKG